MFPFHDVMGQIKGNMECSLAKKALEETVKPCKPPKKEDHEERYYNLSLYIYIYIYMCVCVCVCTARLDTA